MKLFKCISSILLYALFAYFTTSFGMEEPEDFHCEQIYALLDKNVELKKYDNNRKRQHEDTFAKSKKLVVREPLYKKRAVGNDEKTEEDIAYSLPEIRLKHVPRKGQKKTLLNMTLTALPYFLSLQHMIKGIEDNKAITLNEAQISLSSIEIINMLIPLLHVKAEAQLDAMLVKKLTSLTLNDEDIVKLFEASDFLNCKVLLEACTKRAAQLCFRKNREEVLEFIKSLNLNLRGLLVEQLHQDCFTVTERHVLSSPKNKYKMWSRPLGEGQHIEGFGKCDVSHDGNYIAAYFFATCSIVVWDINTGKYLKRLCRQDGSTVRFLEGMSLLTNDCGNVVYWEKIQQGKQRLSNEKGEGGNSCHAQILRGQILPYGPYGAYIVGKKNNLFLNSLYYSVDEPLFGSDDHITSIKVLPSCQVVAASSQSGNIKSYSIKSKEIVDLKATLQYKNVSSLLHHSIMQFSHNENLFAYVEEHEESPFLTIKTIQWDELYMVPLEREATGYEALEFSPHDSYIAVYSFHPEDTVSNPSIKIFDIITKKYKKILRNSSPIVRLCFSPDETLLAALCHNKTLKIWDIKMGKCLFTKMFDELADEIKFSIDGKLIVYASEKVYIFNIYRPHFNSLKVKDILSQIIK
jgi:WD40 repeat protein